MDAAGFASQAALLQGDERQSLTVRHLQGFIIMALARPWTLIHVAVCLEECALLAQRSMGSISEL